MTDCYSIASDRHFDYELHVPGTATIGETISSFFAAHREIVGDKAYISFLLEKRIQEERDSLKLTRATCDAPHCTITGKRIFVRHDVIPHENNGREHYVYAVWIHLDKNLPTKFVIPPSV